jgi:hypothetical protein
VLTVAGAIGGQVLAASPAALTAPWTRIRHSLLTSNDWVLNLPDDRSGSGIGKLGQRANVSWAAEVADGAEGSVSFGPDVRRSSGLAEDRIRSPRWPSPTAPRGPPGVLSS